MRIKPTISQEMYNDIDDITLEEARKLVNQHQVEITKMDYETSSQFHIDAVVKEEKKYTVQIEVQQAEIMNVGCQCEEYKRNYGSCKHIIATMLEVENNPKYEQTKKIDKSKEKYTEFNDIMNTFYGEKMKLLEQSEETTKALDSQIQIVPKLVVNSHCKELSIEFKIGTEKQLYKLKDLALFYDTMIANSIYKYGEKLQFIHQINSFEETSKELANFLMKYGEMMKYANHQVASGYHFPGKVANQNTVILSHTALDEIFNILKEKEVTLEKDYEPKEIKLVEEEPTITFELEKVDEKEYKLMCSIETYHTYQLFEGKAYTYFLQEDRLYRCSKGYADTVLKLLEVFRRNFTREIKFNQKQISNFFSIVLPKVEKYIILDSLDIEEIESYMPQELKIKVLLDINEKNYIVAKLVFCYGEEEFNPLERNPMIPRNIMEEVDCLNLLRKTGFMLDRKNAIFVLVQEEKIFEFLAEEMPNYQKMFEVLVTDAFKEKQIRKPKISNLGVRVENNLLTLNFGQFNFDKAELKEILSKYRIKKKYHRLKDGTFLTLEENEEINFIESLLSGTDVEYKELSGQSIQIPVSRTLYLEQILNTIGDTKINKEESYLKMVSSLGEKEKEIEQLPEGLQATLRNYQKTGYQWLRMLDQYSLGGILADDMGLGKTIQLITMMLAYKQSNETNKKPILVVCPSSLSLNWKNETSKFAPNLSTLVITGSAEQRRQQIQQIKKYDVIITSYDLLKRDIDNYTQTNYEFRYMIADEAQYIKNSNTQNAKALKQIKAQTRYALTGTPIENSLSELWSIFDFLMPGYLFSYRKFKEYYESPIIKENDRNAMRKLKMLIEPFILRRTKKEVLTELPDKTITILNNEMEEEQQKIYLSYLAQARTELTQEVQANTFEKSQIKILALLTRLRQLCCHPGLFIDNYKGECSKLIQCVEIIKDGIESGHKILLFSGYTSMFDIIEKELKREKIRYFKLTGQTKVNDRIHLVDKFNEDSDIKVFLISLKAGGTGLNLTGADMVIHYDPWWNVSAENQATDRAYRIGQKNNVQVYKLITKNSIEEKIYELQEKKAKLIDNVLDTKASFINALSKEDIMKLFE